MSWDSSQPAAGVKIRLLPTQTNENFQAIELGNDADTDVGSTLQFHSISLGDRSTIAVSADPQDETTVYQLYAKNDGTNIEWFAKNTAASITQMTRGAPTVSALGSTFLPGGLLMKWGTKAITSGAGAKPAISYDAAFTTAVYSLVVTPLYATSTTDNLGQLNAAPGLASFVWRSNVAVPYTIYWVAIGV